MSVHEPASEARLGDTYYAYSSDGGSSFSANRRPDRLARATIAEVGRLRPVGAYLIGSASSLSEGVVDALADAGVPRPAIVRLAGQGPASTAAIVAEALDRRSDVESKGGKAAFAEAVIVNPSSSTAAAAVAYAATFGRPILLTDQDGVPAETTTALRSLGIASTLVVGDEAAVGARAAGQLPGAARAGGRDATEAAVSMAEVARTAGAPSNIVYVANAGRPTDAAVVAAAVARVGGLLLLTPDAEVLRADRAISDLGWRAPLTRSWSSLTTVLWLATAWSVRTAASSPSVRADSWDR